MIKKIIPEWVKKVREMRNDKISEKEIAKKYGVSRQAINNIINFNSYKEFSTVYKKKIIDNNKR